MVRLLVTGILLVYSLAACRERYGLPLEASREGLLVVEGNILNGDTTKIRRSRTSPISERTLIPETGANVQIEGDDNSVYHLAEAEPGLYKSDFLTLNNANRYRLKIQAKSNEYESEWLDVISTAEIDSVIWERNNGVKIAVSSHGTPDDSRYYKWDYDEVWEFHADYESRAYFTYVVDENGIRHFQNMDVTRDGITYNSYIEAYCQPYGECINDTMYYCWKYNSSSNINIGSTAALSDNSILAPIRSIEDNGFELSYLYSILVKQTGLSPQGYEFYRILEGNTESLGTIFDAQPSEMKTNLKCVTNPNEVVIGFIDATSVKSKRIFISIRQLRDWHNFDGYDCTDTMSTRGRTIEQAVSEAIVSGKVPLTITINPNPPHQIVGFTMANRYCADCRMRGVHKKPDFWP